MTRRPQNRENRRRRKRKVFTNRMRGRLKFVFGCVMVGFGVLGAKIIWINAQKGSQYKQQNTHERTFKNNRSLFVIYL